MKKQTKKKMYRQGDVLICAVDAAPNNLTPVPRDPRGVVLAEGEATGHFHGIKSRSASLFRTEEDVRYMRVTAPVMLKHQEHSPIKIPRGEYRVTIHTQYQPGELPVNVED
jgi:hypothetical protein